VRYRHVPAAPPPPPRHTEPSRIGRLHLSRCDRMPRCLALPRSLRPFSMPCMSRLVPVCTPTHARLLVGAPTTDSARRIVFRRRLGREHQSETAGRYPHHKIEVMLRARSLESAATTSPAPQRSPHIATSDPVGRGRACLRERDSAAHSGKCRQVRTGRPSRTREAKRLQKMLHRCGRAGQDRAGAARRRHTAAPEGL
jgi:hypothetical protein